MKACDNTNLEILKTLRSGAFQGYFGGCPFCGHSEGPYHIGPVHWLVCRDHFVRWWIGENLFMAWRSETRADWESTCMWLGEFQMVEPVYGAESNPDGEADDDVG